MSTEVLPGTTQRGDVEDYEEDEKDEDKEIAGMLDIIKGRNDGIRQQLENSSVMAKLLSEKAERLKQAYGVVYASLVKIREQKQKLLDALERRGGRMSKTSRDNIIARIAAMDSDQRDLVSRTDELTTELVGVDNAMRNLTEQADFAENMAAEMATKPSAKKRARVETAPVTSSGSFALVQLPSGKTKGYRKGEVTTAKTLFARMKKTYEEVTGKKPHGDHIFYPYETGYIPFKYASNGICLVPDGWDEKKMKELAHHGISYRGEYGKPLRNPAPMSKAICEGYTNDGKRFVGECQEAAESVARTVNRK
jgi:hypothetical protein